MEQESEKPIKPKEGDIVINYNDSNGSEWVWTRVDGEKELRLIKK